MTTDKELDTLNEQVMTGIERLMTGDAEYVNALPETASNIVLIISARTMAEFCDEHEGRPLWGADAGTWDRLIAHLRGLAAETEELLGDWFTAWIEHGASPERAESPVLHD